LPQGRDGEDVSEITPAEFRSHFPIFRDKVHLCSCSEGAASVQAMAAVDRFVESWRERGAPWDAWMEEVDRARLRFAELINARPHEVAVVPNASIGAYAVASALRFGPDRDGIVTSDLEFPSIAHVWLAQAERGAAVRHVRHEQGVIPVEAWQAAIGPHTRLVSAFHASYANGARNDLAAIGKLARDQGAHFFVDAYQGVGVVPIDVRALEVDFLVAGTLKYLCGTPGMAFLYVREELAPTLVPSVTGWFARRQPFAFDPFTLDYAGDARRFQTGTPAIVAAFTANAGMALLAEVGVERIWPHVRELTASLTRRLQAEGFTLFSPADAAYRGPQVSAYVEDANAVGQQLAERGIIVSPRGQAIRMSFHYYNNHTDVARAADELVTLARPKAQAPA
jgi:selenocysteine lyase/cysteine desulfurase